MTGWVYLLGETKTADTIKIGYTAGTLAERIRSINRDQHTDDTFALLAAARGNRQAEKALHRYFETARMKRGSRTEYFHATQPLIEYVLWLRRQYFTATDPTTTENELPLADLNEWIPSPTRRTQPPIDDRTALIPATIQFHGPLAGTAWNWIPNPLQSFQDYFTPPHIVAAAETAMGGIDLDAASHFLANRDLINAGIQIKDYYTAGHSAFDHEWKARVWLNPPYGDNAPWWRRIQEQMDNGTIEQLCMLSPIYVFNTRIARPIVDKSSAMLVLSPALKFKNPSDPTMTGTNHPHAIMYWGTRTAHFLEAFAPYGIRCEIV